MQDLLAAFCNQHNLSLQDVYELLSLGMPMPLAGPGAWGQFKEIDADLLEPRRCGQSMSNLVLTWRSERLWISRAGRNGCALDSDLLLHPDLAF